jgi:hypothetical protein
VSWEQLLAITQEAAESAALPSPTEQNCCPRDGTTLVTNSAGIRGCTFCGWRTDQGDLCP